MGAISIRLARRGDAEAIAEIYNYEVLNTTATFDLVPRSIEDQRQWLAQRSGAFAAVVAVDDETDEVVGFASLSPYKDRAAYSTTVENSIYVRRDEHGRGVGKRLLNHVLDLARDTGFHVVIARIEASGTASRALHESCGYTLVGVEREVGRKFKRWMSVAVMQCMLHDRDRGAGDATPGRSGDQ
ncbi:MAG: N-acetyltransferase family protein [Ilumatobacteraceae bacterium]